MSLLAVGEIVTVMVSGVAESGPVLDVRDDHDDGSAAIWEPDDRRARFVLPARFEGLTWMRGSGPEVEVALRAAFALWNCKL